MNVSIVETIYERQRCRTWTPLYTQQERLRHIQQILLYNVDPPNSCKFYFTLHLSAMCSPFYTSATIDQGFHQKWSNLDFRFTEFSSISVFVLRIWQKKLEDLDSKLLSWGVNLSGLVYLGNKILEIQPDLFKENTVIFQFRGGFFTSHHAIKSDLQKPLSFVDVINIVSDEESTKVIRHSREKFRKNDVRNSYDLKKLLRIHSLQLNLRNKLEDIQKIKGKICLNCGMAGLNLEDEFLESEKVKSPPDNSQLLTMNILNKLLFSKEKPTRAQMQKIVNIKKEIEVKKFRTKLLLQERDKKSAKIRYLNQKFSNLIDENEEKASFTMNNYRQLNKDSEKLKEWKAEEVRMKENLQHILVQLNHRQKQLMTQLLDIYPITSTPDYKFSIHNVHLPNSDAFYDCSDSSLPVALGYIAHVLLMCSTFLQVPLRYPIVYFGSRSHILDHITSSLVERDRDFPLYTRGKDKMQFTYAVYLLNKNIAQLRWFCGQYTPNLRGTLPNLLSLLQGKESRTTSRHYYVNHHDNVSFLTSPSISTAVNSSFSGLEENMASAEDKSSKNVKDIVDGASVASVQFNEAFQPKPFGFVSNKSDPVIDMLRHEYHLEKSKSPTRRNNRRTEKNVNHENLGLSQILTVPEAYMSKQISSVDFKEYLSKRRIRDYDLVNKCNFSSEEGASKSTDVEQGTDILNSCNSFPPSSNSPESTDLTRLHSDETLTAKLIKQNRRKSRSVGSFTDEESYLSNVVNFEVGSDPLINISSEKNEDGLVFAVDDSRKEFLQKWMNNGSVLASSDENFFPEDSSSPKSNETTLNERTNALMSKTSFNLVKPK